MKEKQQAEVVETSAEEAGVVLINESGDFVDVNKRAAEILRQDRDTLLSMDISDVATECPLEHGKVLEKKLSSEFSDEVTIKGDDGSSVLIQSESEPLTIDGERHARCVIKEVSVVEEPTPETEPGEQLNPSMFDDIGDEELANIVQNIRVDAPDGEMPLNAIMLDLAVGHNELEQYKKGALTLHEAVDERLVEEEQRNPDSPECEVLREVKQTAFGLYLRLQRGDEELHGNREGRYSGYFN